MLLAVGGHSRNIGKTSVMTGLIRALPEAGWTAVKITQFGHGRCSADGKPCQCSRIAPDHPYALTEETDAGGRADTQRYLAAGALRSFWLRTAMGQLEHAVPAIRRLLESGENAIVESTSLLEFFQPDLYLVVLDAAVRDFKPSTRRFLGRADAFVVIQRPSAAVEWPEVDQAVLAGRPRFLVTPPEYVPPPLAEFVRAALRGGPASRSNSPELV